MEISSIIPRLCLCQKCLQKWLPLFLETTPCRYSQSHTHWLFDKTQLLLLFPSSDFIGFPDLRDSSEYYYLLGTINRIIYLVSMWVSHSSVNPWRASGVAKMIGKSWIVRHRIIGGVILKAWFNQQTFTARMNIWMERNQLGSQILFWVWTWVSIFRRVMK